MAMKVYCVLTTPALTPKILTPNGGSMIIVGVTAPVVSITVSNTAALADVAVMVAVSVMPPDVPFGISTKTKTESFAPAFNVIWVGMVLIVHPNADVVLKSKVSAALPVLVIVCSKLTVVFAYPVFVKSVVKSTLRISVTSVVSLTVSKCVGLICEDAVMTVVSLTPPLPAGTVSVMMTVCVALGERVIAAGVSITQPALLCAAKPIRSSPLPLLVRVWV